MPSTLLNLNGAAFTLQDITDHVLNSAVAVAQLSMVPVQMHRYGTPSIQGSSALKRKQRPNEHRTDGGHQLCLVCSVQDAVITFQKCRCTVSCKDCSVHLLQCPNCRKRVDEYDRLLLLGDTVLVLMYNPVWVLKLSNWEHISSHSDTKKTLSTFFQCMYTNLKEQGITTEGSQSGWLFVQPQNTSADLNVRARCGLPRRSVGKKQTGTTMVLGLTSSWSRSYLETTIGNHHQRGLNAVVSPCFKNMHSCSQWDCVPDT